MAAVVYVFILRGVDEAHFPGLVGSLVFLFFVCFEVVFSLRCVIACHAVVPNDVNVVNILFVMIEVACLLGFEVA